MRFHVRRLSLMLLILIGAVVSAGAVALGGTGPSGSKGLPDAAPPVNAGVVNGLPDGLQLSAAPLNPDFLRWRQDMERGVERSTVDGLPLGERPMPVDFSHAAGLTIPGADRVYPSSYDLRALGKLTSVKNQGAYGTCWAFASMGSMESRLLPTENRDFSEDNMVLQSGFDTGATPTDKYNWGGNLTMAAAYLARWSGPMYESDDAYGDGVTPPGLRARKHIQEIHMAPLRTSPSDNANVKYLLTTYGGVYTSMSWQGASSGSAYYNPTTHAYYYNGAAATNHAVLIVGWDDAYPAANFATPPAGNGAFIVKNSWGTGWGEAGYFYVSYYDTKFATSRSGVAGQSALAAISRISSTTNYNRIYEHDPLGWCYTMGYSGLDVAWGANVYYGGEAPSFVNAVGLYATSMNTQYEVFAGPSLTSLYPCASGTLITMGYHTISTPYAWMVLPGQPFVVAVKLTTPSYNYPMAIEGVLANYSSGASSAAGESYISPDGISWSDMTTVLPPSYAANICLKAYMTPAAMDDDIPGVTLPPSPVEGDLTAITDDDDVFRVPLSPGQTFQAHLVGPAGTDFDLYLFDPAATTISDYADIVGGSNGVIYPDTMTYFAANGGTYYLDVDEFSGSGDYTLAYTIRNESQAPTTTVSGIPASWTKNSVTATFSASDTGGSGLAYTEYNLDGAGYVHGTSVTVSATGSHTVLYRSVDHAGNVEAAHSAQIRIDKAAPITSVSGVPAAWTKNSVTATFSGSDSGGSGLAYTEYSLDGAAYVHGASVTVSAAGTHTLLYRSADGAGNLEAAKSAQIRIDKAAPTTSVSGIPAGWTKSSVTATFSASDSGGSGVAYTEYSLDGAGYVHGTSVSISTAGIHSLQYRSVDNAGNVEAAKSVSVSFDNVLPVSKALAAATVVRGKKVTLRLRVNDLTPRATVKVKIYQGRTLKKTLVLGLRATNIEIRYRFTCKLPVGAYTWKVFATDLAGNIGKASLAKKLTVR